MPDQSDPPRVPARARLDELFEALSHPTRRRILTALVEASPNAESELTLGDFAADAPREDASTSLYHVHLPKLAGSEVIEWDRESEAITHGTRFDEIAPLLELMIDHRDELPTGWP